MPRVVYFYVAYAISIHYILRNVTRQKYFQYSAANCDLDARTQNCQVVFTE